METEPINIVGNILCYAGKQRREVSNPHITAREAIELANYMVAQSAEIERLKGLHNPELVPAAAHMIVTQRDEIERLKGLLPAWIPVSGRLPPPNKKVLVFYANAAGKGRTVCGFHCGEKERDSENYGGFEEGDWSEDGEHFYWPDGWYEEIENWDDGTAVAICYGEPTHWMPLPAPTEAGEASALERAAAEAVNQSAEIERLKGLLRDAADTLYSAGWYADDIRKYRLAGEVTK